jgi:putative ABC transport system permease protein
MGSNMIQVVPKGLRGPPTGSQGLVIDDVDVVDKVRGVEYATAVYSSRADVEFGRNQGYDTIYCYESDKGEDAFNDYGNELSEGRFFASGEKGNVVVNEKLAKDGFDKEIRLKSSIYIEDRKFKVIGIEKDAGASGRGEIIMTMEDCRSIFEEQEAISLIVVKVMDGFDVDFVSEDIQERLERARDEEIFEVYTPEKLLGQLSDILGIVSAILGAIAGISLVVGGMGIMNSMYTNVLERTKEIGVMKAVGAKNSQVMMMFLVESGFYGLVGGVIGVIFGVGLSKLVEIIAVQGFGFELLKIEIDFVLIGGALLFAFVVGCLSGIFPSRRAAKMKPVDALRYE